ncbi:hypothetical protein TNCV_2305471 [Trichonephila clavipes]|nr:hypothetical protein TNCV_2305471 [Trichonephila clavipes]
MGEIDCRRLALGGERESRRMFSWPIPKQIVFYVRRKIVCLRPHNSLIHFSRDKTRNPTPTSNLNLDAPTFVPGQIEGSVEANSQSQFVATGRHKSAFTTDNPKDVQANINKSEIVQRICKLHYMETWTRCKSSYRTGLKTVTYGLSNGTLSPYKDPAAVGEG